MNTKKITKSAAPSAASSAAPSLARSEPLVRIGFLGLGIMGSAMAGNLIRAGFQVSGFDPTAKARQHLKAAGGKPCRSAAELVASVQVVICSLPNATALKENAEILATAGHKGLLVIETSTLDPRDKEAARARVAKSGVVLLDCPLSGTGAQAKRKDLTVYASGSKADIRRLVPVFEGFSKAHFDLGTFGNGMKMKLMANLLVAIHNVSTAEALLLGQRWGISPRKAVEVLSDGAGGSRMLQVRGPFMEDEGWKEVTMKISVWQKDMYLISQALAETQVAAPLFAATVPIYNAAMGMGHASHDTAAVFDVLSRMCSEPTKSVCKSATKSAAKSATKSASKKR